MTHTGICTNNSDMKVPGNLKHTKYWKLTKTKQPGLKELPSNPNIVIKKADKGSAVVVMNTTDYLRKGYRQLNDEIFYTKLDHDPTHRINEH